MKLYLRPSTFWCEANHRIALLDLETQRYFCLPEAAVTAFQKLISGSDLDATDADALKPLTTRNMLTALIPPPDVQSDLAAPALDVGAGLNTRPELLKTVRALCAYAAAALLLKTRRLKTIIETIRARKAADNQGHLPCAAVPSDHLIGAFMQTARLIKTHDRCLLNSLAMQIFLAHYGRFPALVLGVKLSPFGAHAWVQSGDTVLNDSLDNVRPFTPILVV